MNPISAAKRVFKNYAVFYGRATRSEYWNWVLFQVLVFCSIWIINIGVAIFIAWSAQNSEMNSGAVSLALVSIGMTLLYWLALLATIVPSLAVGARRLHDAGLSAWWLFLNCIPLIGAIALIAMYCQPSIQGYSRFENEGNPHKGMDPYNPPSSNL